MSDKKIVLTTAGTREEAGKIARALVERQLAACVNVVAVDSVYRWKEKLENAQEWLLLIKTVSAAFDDVEGAIKELHSYELPECVVVSIEGGSEEYLDWLADNVDVG